jgi:hypothetical protein
MESICPRCNVRLLPGGAGRAPVPSPGYGHAAAAAQESPPGLIVLAIAHGVAAAAALRVLFGPLLDLHQSGALPLWVILPSVLYLSAVAAFCGFSCFGLLSRAEWAEGETRRALGALLVLFPIGTVWGVAWFAYLKRLSRPAAIVMQPPPPPAPPAVPVNTPGGTMP